MEAQSQEVKKLFEEYNKMVHNACFVFCMSYLCRGFFLFVSFSHQTRENNPVPLMSCLWLADVPVVKAVHPVGRDPEEAGGGQRHPARRVTGPDDLFTFLVDKFKLTSV